MLCGGNGGRSAIVNEALLGVPRVNDPVDLGLGFLRRYLATLGAHKRFVSKAYLSDLNHVLANPRLRRFFSSEAPKKKSNYFLIFFFFAGFLFGFNGFLLLVKKSLNLMSNSCF